MKIPYGYVYRIRNKINGKTYVGQRKLSLDKRWRQYMGSGVAVKAAIAKYGIDAFTKELLAYSFSYDELNKIEVEITLQERKDGKAEYNLHIGSPVPQSKGGYVNLTPEEKERVYAALAEKNRDRHRLNYEIAIASHKDEIISLYNEHKSCQKVADQLEISVKYVNRFLKEVGTKLNHQNAEGRVLDDELRKRISDGLKKSSVRYQLECNECGLTFESRSFKRKTCGECSVGDGKIFSSKRGASLRPIIIAICNVCNNEFENRLASAKYCSHKCSTESNRKELPPIEVIEKLYWEEKISANKIGMMYSVSGQTIRNYMRDNGIDRRKERHSS